METVNRAKQKNSQVSAAPTRKRLTNPDSAIVIYGALPGNSLTTQISEPLSRRRRNRRDRSGEQAQPRRRMGVHLH